MGVASALMAEGRAAEAAQIIQKYQRDRSVSLNRDAMSSARLADSAYVGFLQLMLHLQLTRMSVEEFDAYDGHVVETLIPA